MQFVTPTRRGWMLNYYITQCTGNSISWWQDAVEKASTQQREPSGPWLISLEIRWVGEKMLEWEHVPKRLGPQVPGWAAQENGKETLGQYVAVLFGLQLPLTHNPFNKVRGIFFLRTVSLVTIVSSLYSACICRCICIMCLYSWSCSWLYNNISAA